MPMSIRFPRPSRLVTVLTAPSTVPFKALIVSTAELRSSTPRSLPPTRVWPKLPDDVADEWASVSAAVATAEKFTPWSEISGALVSVPSRSLRTPVAVGFRPPRALVRMPDTLVTVEVMLPALQADSRPPMPLTGRFSEPRSPPRMPIGPWRTDRSGTRVPTRESTAESLLWASILTGLIVPLARMPAPIGVAVPATDTALVGKLTAIEGVGTGTLLEPGATALKAG